MSFRFTNPASYAYRPGSLFLGLDPATGAEIGVQTERHAITIAGSRTGKGASLIIQNLKRWPHAVLVIDPKGENARATWKDRKALGQKVAVLDPFGVSGVPRATFNPLDGIEANAPRSRERLLALADGMVVVHDPKHEEWAEGARSIIAGLMAYVIGCAPPEHRNLSTVRGLLLQPDSIPTSEGDTPGGLYADAQRMLSCDACGGLARAAGGLIIKGIETQQGLPPQVLEKSRRATAWIDAPEMAAMLARSSFKLTDLKCNKLSLYLVLQPDELREYSAFLRLFVRAALKVMMTDEPEQDHRCLFILDEFYSLGRINVIAEAAGLMAGYGVNLWPFILDLGALHTLYGKALSETFFNNADAHVFFGNNDILTLQTVSERLGRINQADIGINAPVRRAYKPGLHQGIFESEAEGRERVRIEDDNAAAQYAHQMRLDGKQRLSPSDIAELVGKGNGEKVSRSMIVFAKNGDALNLQLAPYFETSKQPPHMAVNKYSASPSMHLPPPKKYADYSFGEVVELHINAMFSRAFKPADKEIFLGGVKAFFFWHTFVVLVLVAVGVASVAFEYGLGEVTRKPLGLTIRLIEWAWPSALWVGIPVFFLHHLLETNAAYKGLLQAEKGPAPAQPKPPPARPVSIDIPEFYELPRTDSQPKTATLKTETATKPKTKKFDIDDHNKNIRYRQIKEQRGEKVKKRYTKKERDEYLAAHDALPREQRMQTVYFNPVMWKKRRGLIENNPKIQSPETGRARLTNRAQSTNQEQSTSRELSKDQA